MKTYTRKQLSEELLCRAEDMIAELQTRALGEEPIFPDANPSMLNKFFELYADITKNTMDIGEAIKVEAETSHDLVKAVCEGKITLKDAEKLMGLIHAQREVEKQVRIIFD